MQQDPSGDPELGRPGERRRITHPTTLQSPLEYATFPCGGERRYYEPVRVSITEAAQGGGTSALSGTTDS